MSLIPIAIFCSISFFLGAFWHMKHTADTAHNTRAKINREDAEFALIHSPGSTWR